MHPDYDGVTPGQQQGGPVEDMRMHMMDGSVSAPNLPCGGVNPEAGYEPSVEMLAQMGPEAEEREFSVTTDNEAVLTIFSYQEECERLFSEVIDSEETAIVGDLKIEKVSDESNTVIVTDSNSGDQAKVTLYDDEMDVTELDQKEFSMDEQFEPIFVVGIDAGNHVIVDSPCYSEEAEIGRAHV